MQKDKQNNVNSEELKDLTINNLRKKICLGSEGNWKLFTYKDEIIRGDFDKFKDRLYVKKGEYEDFNNEELSEQWKNAITIRFDTKCIDVEFLDKIFDHHIHLLVNKSSKTFIDALEKTFDYFANNFSEALRETLWGDMGEAIFILKTFEHTNKNIINNIHQQDDGLYDFSFENGKYIEVKSTSLDKNEVILTNCQIDYTENRDFVIVKFKKIEQATTIIDMYDIMSKKIGALSDCLKEKYNLYKNFKELKYFSVNMESVEIGVLNNNSVPQFEIKNESALKKAKFYLDVTDNIESFEKYIKSVDLK